MTDALCRSWQSSGQLRYRAYHPDGHYWHHHAGVQSFCLSHSRERASVHTCRMSINARHFGQPLAKYYIYIYIYIYIYVCHETPPLSILNMVCYLEKLEASPSLEHIYFIVSTPFFRNASISIYSYFSDDPFARRPSLLTWINFDLLHG